MQRKSQQVFKKRLLDVLDEFVAAVHNANKQRTADEAPIEYTFENFLKYMQYPREKRKEIEKGK
jgi:hypothetical protein